LIRKSFFRFISWYLLLLFVLFLSAGILFVVLGHSHYFLLGMVLLFLIFTIPFYFWMQELEKGMKEMTLLLNKIQSGDWDAPLFFTSIAELWNWLIVFHDFRNKLQEKITSLEGEREKLVRVLSNLKEGILVADLANRIVMANEAIGNFFHIPSSQLIGKSLDAFMDGEFASLFNPLIQGEEVAKVVSMFSPEQFFFFQSFFPKSIDGSLVAKGMVLRDITESQKVENLRKAFVANASHELRSPVASLQAILDAFEAGGLEDREKRTKFLGMMKKEVMRLNAIIQDLLDLSEMEREKEFPKEPLKIAELFQQWLEGYEARILEKKLHVSTQFLKEPIVLHAFLPDIERLFRNLFENALKYTPAGGSIEIGLKKEDNFLMGWIKDSGIGIPKEHIPRIFERFYRVDKSRSRSMGGTGLGLSIAKHAVERHGGKIWVESQENQGSTFYFSFPLTQA
jgi:signal transduction histidine kinase